LQADIRVAASKADILHPKLWVFLDRIDSGFQNEFIDQCHVYFLIIKAKMMACG